MPDDAAFVEATEPFRRELLAHRYRGAGDRREAGAAAAVILPRRVPG
ncbi:hypothetical protein [Pseudonocardia dioxanivorans]|nr:hypothetical protein [Pseudonocardia dioxanivorans]